MAVYKAPMAFFLCVRLPFYVSFISSSSVEQTRVQHGERNQDTVAGILFFLVDSIRQVGSDLKEHKQTLRQEIG